MAASDVMDLGPDFDDQFECPDCGNLTFLEDSELCDECGERVCPSCFERNHDIHDPGDDGEDEDEGEGEGQDG